MTLLIIFSASCSGDTMFEEEEAIWATNRAAWKLPVAYSWPGVNVTLYSVGNVFRTGLSIALAKRMV